MFDKTDSGNKIELLFDRSLERLRRISYHSLRSPEDVSRTSFLVEMGGTVWCSSEDVEGEWVVSRRSSGGVWPLAIRSVTFSATEK